MAELLKIKILDLLLIDTTVKGFTREEDFKLPTFLGIFEQMTYESGLRVAILTKHRGTAGEDTILLEDSKNGKNRRILHTENGLSISNPFGDKITEFFRNLGNHKAITPQEITDRYGIEKPLAEELNYIREILEGRRKRITKLRQ